LIKRNNERQVESKTLNFLFYNEKKGHSLVLDTMIIISSQSERIASFCESSSANNENLSACIL